MAKTKTDQQKSSSEKINFEQSLMELNQLIEKMEAGDLPLEKSLDCFEQGIKLIKQCQLALEKAEQKVQILVKKNGKEQLIKLENHDD